MNTTAPGSQLDWLDPVKGMALFAVLLSHLVEEFGPGPWFTNPQNDWPEFPIRISQVFPQGNSLLLSLVRFLGWLGDNGPGVFILLSGVGLTWSKLHKPKGKPWLADFVRRRITRIFPLYIVMHVVILGGSLLVPGSNLRLISGETLMSILGLRWTDDLFYYISPSWWFVWLILQLYCVFPVLYVAMERLGTTRFLVITCAFTFASRFLGIMYSSSLYNWMSGIFFGTRLAEFCAGMALAVWLSRLKETGSQLPSLIQVLSWIVPTYLLGLICSFTWAGSVVSNLLVTLGMAGLFYATWRGFISKVSLLSGTVVWVGVEAYSVYLFHHPPLLWTAVFFPGNTLPHLAAALLVLAASFPAGWLLNKGALRLQHFG